MYDQKVSSGSYIHCRLRVFAELHMQLVKWHYNCISLLKAGLHYVPGCFPAQATSKQILAELESSHTE